MEMIEFYRECKAQRQVIHDFFMNRKEIKDGYPTSSVESLSYYILNMTINVISFSANYLEDEEEVCYKCIYHRMDMARKAITRYLILETEDKGEYEDLLKSSREKLNDWCKFIHKSYDMRCEEEHVHIINPAYAEIQLELDYDDDEEDD